MTVAWKTDGPPPSISYFPPGVDPNKAPGNKSVWKQATQVDLEAMPNIKLPTAQSLAPEITRTTTKQE